MYMWVFTSINQSMSVYYLSIYLYMSMSVHQPISNRAQWLTYMPWTDSVT